MLALGAPDADRHLPEKHMLGDALHPPARLRLQISALALLAPCWGWLLACTACGALPTEPPPREGPYALLLGSAQDAGLPQIGCRDVCCEAARADPMRRRLASSLLIVDPASGGRWLLDAGPDLREQVERMTGHPGSRDQRLAEWARKSASSDDAATPWPSTAWQYWL